MSIRPSYQPLPHVKDANILFLDTETGGLSAARTDIIEIGCVLTDPSGRDVIEEWETKVVPTRPVEPDAARINGYVAEKWAAEGVPLATAMAKVLAMAKGAVMCCHNAPFDKGFLDAALSTCRQRWTGRYHTLCTVSLAQPFLRRGLVADVKLETLARYFGVGHSDAHRALPDAKTCREVYLKMQDILEPAIDAYAASRP
jgi:DNA polymerase-3 subunit epsilon